LVAIEHHSKKREGAVPAKVASKEAKQIRTVVASVAEPAIKKALLFLLKDRVRQNRKIQSLEAKVQELKDDLRELDRDVNPIGGYSW
jgi:hypothetical protein